MRSGKRTDVIPADQPFIFEAYGFPKAAKTLAPEDRSQVPTQDDINGLVGECINVPVTADHGQWEVIRRRNGNTERVCHRPPRIVGKVTNAYIDDQERLVLTCELDPTLYGMTQAQLISNGTKRDVSLGLLTQTSPDSGVTKFTLDHVAIVPRGRAKGTHITRASCAAMPHLNFDGREFGLDPDKHPLAAQVHRHLMAKNSAHLPPFVKQSRKSTLGTSTKTLHDISLYSAEDARLSIGPQSDTSVVSESSAYSPSSSVVQCSTADSEQELANQQQSVPETSRTHYSSPFAFASPLEALVKKMNTTPSSSNTPAMSAAPAVASDAAATQQSAMSTDGASSAATNAPVTTNSPISASDLSNALSQSIPNAASGSPDASNSSASGDASANGIPVGKFVADLLQNPNIPDDEKVVQLSEKYAEDMTKMLQMEQQLEQHKKMLAEFEAKGDVESRQRVETQIELLKKAVETSPNSAKHINPNVLSEYQAALMEMPPAKRDLFLAVNDGIAAFGEEVVVKMSYEDPQTNASVGNHDSSMQDELTRLRMEEQASRKRAEEYERKARLSQVLSRLGQGTSAGFSASTSSSSASSHNAFRPQTSGTAAFGSNSSLHRMMEMSNQRASMPIPAGGAVSNFGASPSVSSNFSNESFIPAISGGAPADAPSIKRGAMDPPATPAKMDTSMRTSAMGSSDVLAKLASLDRKRQALAATLATKKPKGHY